jgi:lantibiotic biosynthesis protein
VRPESDWTPILEGELAELAQEAVLAIAKALLHAVPGPKSSLSEPSLSQGDAGLALFHAAMARSWPDSGHEQRARERLEQAEAALAEVPLVPGLYAGFTGVAWAVQHQMAESGAEDRLEAIDEALLELTGQSPWTHDFDLIHGLAGFGVYAVERLPRPSAALLLGRILDRLEETAERHPEGLTWRTEPELLHESWRRELPDGGYNLGLAHGVPGIVGLLGLMCRARILQRRARRLLERAVTWLLAQRLAGCDESSYPAWLAPGRTAAPARSAWCYGDPGVAAALLLAARGAGEPAWEREALALARKAARRPVDRAGVVDAGLCHGSAGLAHLYNRMAQATGDELLAQAARTWFRRTLEMRREGQGLAGLTVWTHGEDGELSWNADPGLLNGAAGIGLALLAAIGPHEPDWDRVLLVSIPPRR